MNTARVGHTATLMPNGKVLVTGGYTGNGYAEVYDPNNQTWTMDTTLQVGVIAQTATVLQSGKVLIVGGYFVTGITNVYLNTSRVYDSTTGTWSWGGNLSTGHAWHTATLLPSGQVLVVGGMDGVGTGLGITNAAELWDPNGAGGAGSWSTTVNFPWTTHRHTATLMPVSGKVVVCGGQDDNGSYLNAIFIYDPSGGGSWTGGVASLPVARAEHTANLLPDGRILLAGGYNSGGIFNTTVLYTPSTGGVAAGANMGSAKTGHKSVLLDNGQILVSGGQNTGALSAVQLYDPSTGGGWTPSTALPTSARSNHTVTLLPDYTVLAVGGMSNASTFLNTAVVFDPYNPGAGWVATSNTLPTTNRAYHTATLLRDGKVLVAGGMSNATTYLATAAIYNPATHLWASTGPMATARRYHTATLLPNGKVLVTGGQSATSTYLDSMELYDPGSGGWTTLASVLPTTREWHTATLMPATTTGQIQVLFVGGYNGTYLTSAALFEPSTLSWTMVATGAGTGFTVARNLHTATLLADGRVMIAGGQSAASTFLNTAIIYDRGAGTWTATANTMPSARFDHTATLLPNGSVLVAGGQSTATAYLGTSALYNPSTRSWTATTTALAGAHVNHTATLLSTGQVLLTGGQASSTSFVATTATFDPGLGFNAAWAPAASPASSSVAGTSLTLLGYQFTGYNYTQGSGGDSLSSPSNYPVVRLRSLSNEQTWYLPCDPASSWSDNTFTSLPVENFTPGYAMVTVFSNGIPSQSAIINVDATAPVVTPTVAGDVSLTPTGATLGVHVTSDGGELVTARGVVYARTSVNSNPQIGGTGVTNVPGAGTVGSFTVNLSSLTPNTSYSFESYAINYLGTTYTSAWTFTTPCQTITVINPVVTAGVAGTAFSQSFSQSGGMGATTFSTFYTSLLPTGMSLSSAGVLSGTTSQVGNFVFYVKATDSNGCTGQGATYTLVITAPSTFAVTTSLAAARSGHTATLLANGKVLVAGGYDGTNTLGSAALYDPVTKTWAGTGTMITARQLHTATLLPSGQVLVTGGMNASNVTQTSSELYDPVAGTWSSTGSLATGRDYHTASLLANGKVLVAAGYNSSLAYLDTAEVYDPAAGTWTATSNNLAAIRYQANATVLANGKVLVSGGWNWITSYLNTCELYDPTTNAWSTTGSFPTTACYAATTTLLPNGKVLLAGGAGPGASVSASALYDPSVGTWAATTGSLNTARQWHTATLLPNGKVVVMGGYNSSSAYLSSSEVYDPATALWTTSASLTTAREGLTSTMLTDGTVLVAAGHNGSGYLASAELYNFSNAGKWTASSSPTTRRDHTATLLPTGKVLIAGGSIGSTYLATCELYDPATGTYSSTTPLSSPRWGHTATMLLDGRVLVVGGGSGTSWLYNAEIYDSSTATWSGAGTLTYMRTGSVAGLLPNGMVLITGGENDDSCELYDPSTNSWSVTTSMLTQRTGHTLTVLPNGKVLVAGGANNISPMGSSSFVYLDSAELYDPSVPSWTSAGTFTTTRMNATANLLPTGKVLLAGGFNSPNGELNSCRLYDPSTNSWTTTGSLSARHLFHTATLLLNGKVLLAGGQTAGAFTLNLAEIYNPLSGLWSNAAVLNGERELHQAVLLPGGKVLLSGGLYFSGGFYGSGDDVFDVGLAALPAAVPVLTSATQASAGSGIVLAGTGFTGLSEASGGGNGQSSASNCPVVQLFSLVDNKSVFLRSDATTAWSSTSFTSEPVTGFTLGYAMVTVYVNGVPSLSKIINVQ